MTVNTDKFVVHIEEKNGELRVFANRKIDSKECLPLGYILGYNSLIFKPKEKK